MRPVAVDLPPENIWGHRKKLDYLIEAIDAHKRSRLHRRPLRVLDFGCGNGSAVSCHLHGPDIELWGVDLHEPCIEYARRNFGGPSCHFSTAIPEGVSFDIIVYADVLEHLDDPKGILVAHRPMLADDGIVLGAIPNGYGPFEIESWLDRTFFLSRLLAAFQRLKAQGKSGGREAPPYNFESGHVQFFTQETIRRTLAESGFEVIDFRNGVWMGANVTGFVLGRLPSFVAWNARVADRLPAAMVSTWYFKARRAT